MNWIKLFGVFALAWFLAVEAQAEVIELPPEELAKESVLPVFDRPISVRSRNVVTDSRLDFGLFYGMALSEPIYSVNRFGASLYYHTSEDNAFGFVYVKNDSGLSSYANQLREQFRLDFSRAPAPTQTLMGDWNWKMFYGKMSITKNTVFNVSLYATVAAGMVGYQHKNYLALAPGLGQKFYFGKNFSLRCDLRLFMHQAPIPFLDSKNCTQPGINESCTTQPLPSPGDFSERLTYTTALDVGLSWLF